MTHASGRGSPITRRPALRRQIGRASPIRPSRRNGPRTTRRGRRSRGRAARRPTTTPAPPAIARPRPPWTSAAIRGEVRANRGDFDVDLREYSPRGRRDEIGGDQWWRTRNEQRWGFFGRLGRRGTSFGRADGKGGEVGVSRGLGVEDRCVNLLPREARVVPRDGLWPLLGSRLGEAGDERPSCFGEVAVGRGLGFGDDQLGPAIRAGRRLPRPGRGRPQELVALVAAEVEEGGGHLTQPRVGLVTGPTRPNPLQITAATFPTPPRPGSAIIGRLDPVGPAVTMERWISNPGFAGNVWMVGSRRSATDFDRGGRPQCRSLGP